MFGMGTGGTSPSLPPVDFRVGFVLSLPLRFLLAFLSVRSLSALLPFFPEPSACCYLLLFARFASLPLCFLSSASLLFRSTCSVPRLSASVPVPSVPLPSFRLSASLSVPSLSASLLFPQLSLRSSGCFQLCTFQCTLTTAQVRFNTSDLTIDLFVSFDWLPVFFR